MYSEPLWTILDKFGPLLTTLDHFGPLWTTLDHPEQFWTTFKNYFFTHQLSIKNWFYYDEGPSLYKQLQKCAVKMNYQVPIMVLCDSKCHFEGSCVGQ